LSTTSSFEINMECLGNIRQQNDGLLGVEAVTTT
jgi:hypothetical protein